MVRLFLIALPLALLSGCKTQSDLYCAANPSVCAAGGSDGSNGSDGPMCTTNPDCASHTAATVCDTTMNGGTCVECTTADTHACPGNQCKNDLCQPCTKHSDCLSKACLADGTCAKPDDVAYVRPSGSGAACTDLAPCKTINDALGTPKTIIKVEGAITDDMTTTITGKAVQILGEGASLKHTMNGATLEVKDTGADVRVYDLAITSEMTPKTDATVTLSGSGTPKLSLTRVKIDGCQGIGITASAGMLTMTRNTISNNAGGGILISGGDFDITNSFVTTNGAAANDPTMGMPTLGGVLISSNSAGARRFEFNTVASNVSKITSGVFCGPLVPAVTFSNNIVFSNQGTGATQIAGTGCTWTFSDIGEAVVPSGDINTDPMFVDPNNDNYHITSTSPAKDAANPAATINIDFDGETRPQNGRSDMGADEFTLPP